MFVRFKCFFMAATQLGSSAFMMPMVILLMAILMIVGSAALAQAANSFGLSTKQGYDNMALEGARSGIEYARVHYKNDSPCYNPQGSSPVETVSSGQSGGTYKVTFQVEPVVPAGTTFSPCGSYTVKVTGRVYTPATSSTPRTSKSLQLALVPNAAVAGSGQATAGSGAGSNVNAQLNTFTSGGKTIVFGVMANAKAAYNQSPNYFVCFDLSKPKDPNNSNNIDAQACDGTGNGTASLKANSYIDSNMMAGDSLASSSTGIGGAFNAAGTGGGTNLFLTDNNNSGYFDRETGNYYVNVHRTNSPASNRTDANTDIGWLCVNISTAGAKNCGFRKAGNLAPAFSGTVAAAAPQSMFISTVYKESGSGGGRIKRIYALAGKDVPSGSKRKVYCWDITNTVGAGNACSGQPYQTNLPDYLPDQHQFGAAYGPYGITGYGSSFNDDGNSKVYWTINYSTYSTPNYLRNTSCYSDWGYYYPCQYWTGGGSQKTMGARIDCFDTSLSTPGPCFNGTDANNFLNGQNVLPGSGDQITIDALFMNRLYGDNANTGGNGWVGLTAAPFFWRNTSLAVGGLCQLTHPDVVSHQFMRKPLACYNLGNGTLQTSPPANLASAINSMNGDLSLMISAETSNRLYSPYVIIDSLYVALGMDTKCSGNPPDANWCPGFKRSRGFCYDWAANQPCSQWTNSYGFGSGVVTWDNLSASGSSNQNNPGVSQFVVDRTCINVSTFLGASLYSINRSNGLYPVSNGGNNVGCAPSGPSFIF